MEQITNVINLAAAYSESARKEGFLSLEDEVEKIDGNNLYILKYGLKLVLGGADYQLIDRILSNIIKNEKDKKALKMNTVQKEAVLGIWAGYNPRILILKLLSFLNQDERANAYLNDDLDLDSIDSGEIKTQPKSEKALGQSMFIKQASDLIKITYYLINKARLEGLLSLEEELEDIDYEILKEGLRLVVDGTDSVIISDILSNRIDVQQDENRVRLMTIQKEAVLGIQAGDNINFCLHKLISHLRNSELISVSNSLSGMDFFKENKFENFNAQKKKKEKFSAQAADILQRTFELCEKAQQKQRADKSVRTDIDQEKKAERDIMEYGIQLLIDDINPGELYDDGINYILSNLIGQEQNSETKRLKTMQKEAVLGIQKNENHVFLIHSLLSLISDEELDEVKKIYTKTDFINKFNDILENPRGSQEDINRAQCIYSGELENSAGSREVIDFLNKPYSFYKEAHTTLAARLPEFSEHEYPQTASLIAWHSSGYFNFGSAGAISGILKYTDRSVKNQIIDKLEENNHDLAEEIKQCMFPFKNIILLDDRAIQKVLREIDSQELAKALKGTDAQVQDKIFVNMSKRAVSMLKEDMEYMGPIRASDAGESRRKIVSIIMNLENTGEISIPSSS